MFFVLNNKTSCVVGMLTISFVTYQVVCLSVKYSRIANDFTGPVLASSSADSVVNCVGRCADDCVAVKYYKDNKTCTQYEVVYSLQDTKIEGQQDAVSFRVIITKIFI